MRSFPHGRALALALTLYPTDAAVEDFYCGREPGFAEVNTYLNGVSRCLRSGAKVWFSFTEMYGEDCVLYCFHIYLPRCLYKLQFQVFLDPSTGSSGSSLGGRLLENIERSLLDLAFLFRIPQLQDFTKWQKRMDL